MATNTNTNQSTSNDESMLDWLVFLQGVNESQRRGEFKNAPLSPEARELYQFSRREVMNLPKANNLVHNIALKGALGRPSLDMQALREGRSGFSPAPTYSQEELADVLRGTTPTTPSQGMRGEAPRGGGPGGPGPMQKPGDSGERRPGFNRPLDDTGDPTAMFGRGGMRVNYGEGSMAGWDNNSQLGPGNSVPGRPGMTYGAPPNLSAQEMKDFLAYAAKMGRTALAAAQAVLKGASVGSAVAGPGGAIPGGLINLGRWIYKTWSEGRSGQQTAPAGSTTGGTAPGGGTGSPRNTP